MRVVRTDATGWETVIGIEVHAQIIASSKLFSSGATRFGGAPNAHASYVDAAMPGTLPTINAFSVAQAVRTGLGIGGEVQKVSKFERKHYFYCDMPQGYQITQQQCERREQNPHRQTICHVRALGRGVIFALNSSLCLLPVCSLPSSHRTRR